MFADSLRKFVGERYDFEARRKRVAHGFDLELWQALADIGALGLPFDEQFGGYGGSALDVLLVMESFGRGLVVEPFLPTVVLGGGLLRRAANPSQQEEYIPRIIAGELRLAFAHVEPQARFNLCHVATQARKVGDGYLLDGHKAVVYGAPECDLLLVTARTSGGVSERDGISLFLLPADAAGLERRDYRTMDGFAAAEVYLKGVRVPQAMRVGTEGQIMPAVEAVTDEATAAICGEAIGAMAALNEKCIEYARTRQAFGKAIADFQVIGHRLVDMTVAYEQASALVIKAALLLQNGAPEAARTVSAAKVKVAQEGGFIGKAAVQLHGAIGITDELDVGHYFKRLTAIQTIFGSASHHLQRYMRLQDVSAAGGR